MQIIISFAQSARQSRGQSGACHAYGGGNSPNSEWIVAK